MENVLKNYEETNDFLNKFYTM